MNIVSHWYWLSGDLNFIGLFKDLRSTYRYNANFYFLFIEFFFKPNWSSFSSFLYDKPLAFFRISWQLNHSLPKPNFSSGWLYGFWLLLFGVYNLLVCLVFKKEIKNLIKRENLFIAQWKPLSLFITHSVL